MAEVPTMEVRARLTAETAQFTRGLEQASRSADQFAQSSNRLQGAMTGIGVASAAAITTLIALGTKSFMAAARVDELDVAMNAVGKATGLGYQAIRDAAIATKDMGIEMDVAQQSAIKFAQNNLKLSYASELARAAQDLAVVSGKNSTETFNMLTHAVITGRSEVLKSVGIQKSAGQMYESFAKSIGKSANELTYQEKQTAVATGALKEAAKVAGTYEAAMQSPGKVLRSFARITNDIQVSLGDMLLKGIGPIVFALYEFYKSISKAITSSVIFRTAIEAVKQVIIKLTTPVVKFLQKMKEVFDNFTKVSAAAGEVKANFDPVGDSVKNLAGQIEFLLPAVAAMMAMFATFAGAKVFAAVPILGSTLGMLAGPIGIIAIGFATLYMTSIQVRTAINNLVRSLQPLVSVVVAVGKGLATLAGYGVAVLAKAINGLAAIISSITGFFQRNATITKILTAVVLTLVAAFLAYKLAIIALPIIQAAVAFGMNALAVAQVILTGGQLATIASTNGLAASMLALNATIMANPIGLIVGAIVALVIAIGFAWKESETFREVMTDAFNAVAKVVGEVLGFVFEMLGNLLVGFGELIDVNTTFGKVVSSVFQFVYDAVLSFVSFFIKAVKYIVDGFVNLMTTNKSFASVVENVLNFVIDAFIFFYTFFYRAVKFILDAFVYLFDTHKAFGKIVASVIDFVFKAFFGLLSFFLGFVKTYVDHFIDLFKTHESFRKIVETVFNVIIKIIGHAVTVIVVVLANIIKAVAAVIYYFEQFRNFVAEVWSKVVAGIDRAREFIGSIFEKIGGYLGKLVAWMKDKFADMFDWLAKQAEKIPDWLGGGAVADKLKDLADGIRGVKEESKDNFGLSIGGLIAAAAGKAIDLVSAIDTKVIQASKSWGNYEGGAAGALSSVANKMLDFAAKVTEFSSKDNGSAIVAGILKTAEATSTGLGIVIKGLKAAKDQEFGTLLIDTLVKVAKEASIIMGKVFAVVDDQKFGTTIVNGLVDTAKLASKGLEIVSTALAKMAKADFGDAVVEKTSEAAIKAGNFLIGLAAGVRSFTSEDFVGKVSTNIKELLDSLKTGLGFGDILAEEKKKYNEASAIDLNKDKNAEELEKQADRLKSIREAMQAGIDSIKGVLDDLRQAAKDFADSLKDTIVGFAGLRGIELPDGFIPKAKSLIENMNQRLNKSMQFASQIAQLQALNLDAGALKDIIEAGPIKGAQLAASILGGGTEAISQINSLQKAIEFSGATIGAMGSDAAYSGLIANAQAKYNDLVRAQDTLAVRETAGGNVYIGTDAIKITLNTNKAGSTEEELKMITDKIQEVFGTLAKELAAK
jgi:phage-related protein